MPAPEGNQFWKLRAKHGKDRLFAEPELLLEAANEYFQWCDEHPYKKPEQKKGNTIIPKSFEGDINKLDIIVNIEVPRPYSMLGMCLYLGCGINYFNQFDESIKDRTDEKSKGYSLIITYIRETIQNQQIEGGVIGAYNPMLISRILGLRERTDITSNGNEIQGTNIVITREDYKSLSSSIDSEV